jgi:hypothetical protein
MLSEPTDAWSARRTTTTLLLGAILVVLAAGFIVVGRVGLRTVQAFSELLLVLVLFAAVALVFGRLVRTE